jgi:DNA-binding NarL/FixJ family response regulator
MASGAPELPIHGGLALSANEAIAGPALTPRQREVLRLLGEGRSNKEIARLLNLGEGTVKVHLAALFRNLGVRNRTGAVAAAVRLMAPQSDLPTSSP